MSKMKGEVLQMYYDEHGITLRDRLIRDSSGAASRLSGILSRPGKFYTKNKIVQDLVYKSYRLLTSQDITSIYK
jgi:hypothetical protein